MTDIDKEGASLGDDRIEARTILWAAGVAASPLGKSLGAPLDSAGRVRVCGDLTIPDHPDVFVIGDLAAVDQDGQMVPGVATTAIQEGDHAAENIAAAVRGESYRTFRYVDKGMLATIGRGAGVADIRSVELSGFPAWLAWLVVHIYFMIGFRNRLMVLMEWGLSYMTHERGARLITGSLDRLVPVAPEPEGSATGRRNSRSGEKRS